MMQIQQQQQQQRTVATAHSLAYIPQHNVVVLHLSDMHVQTQSDIDHLDRFIRSQLREKMQHNVDDGNKDDNRHNSNNNNSVHKEKPTLLVSYADFVVEDQAVAAYAAWVTNLAKELFGSVVRINLKSLERNTQRPSSRLDGRRSSVHMANWRDRRKSLIPDNLLKLQKELSRLHIAGERIFLKGEVLHGKLGNYVLMEKLSQGTFGLVRRTQVLPVDMKRPHAGPAVPHSIVAVKCMLRSAIRLLDMEEFIEREIEIMYLLRGCDHVVQIVEHIENAESVFVVMELLTDKGPDGISLGELDDCHDRIDEKSAQVLMKQLARALQMLQRHNIVHRDLQLANLCFDINTGHLKVIDFGAATWSVDPTTNEPLQQELFCGNVKYCSPEMLAHHGYDHATDVFSAGVILFKLLTGYFPFRTARDALEGRLSLHVSDPDPSASATDPSVKISDTSLTHDNEAVFVSANCREVLLGMLHIDPAQRMTAEQILEHPWLSEADDGYGESNKIDGQRSES